MKLYHHVFVALTILFLVGDVADVLIKLSGGQQTDVGFHGADAAPPIPIAAAAAPAVGHVLRAVVVKAVKHAAKAVRNAAKRQGKKSRGGKEHTKNQRPSTKGKHEKGQARKQRDQKRAQERKNKGK